VWVSRYRFNEKYGKWTQRGRKFHCHDEEEYCRTGDKVVIRAWQKMSPIKYYYVRNIVKPTVRYHLLEEDMTAYEKEQLDFNEKLRNDPYKIGL